MQGSEDTTGGGGGRHLISWLLPSSNSTQITKNTTSANDEYKEENKQTWQAGSAGIWGMVLRVGGQGGPLWGSSIPAGIWMARNMQPAEGLGAQPIKDMHMCDS